MIVRRVVRRGERGAVAVEFALTVPIFFAVLGFGISLGMYLWAQQQMLYIAATAARYCAFDLPTQSNSSGLETCAKQQADALISVAPVVGCDATPQTQADLPAPGVSNVFNMKLLRVIITCNSTWLTMMDAIGGSSLAGSRQITVQATMPFISG